LIGVSTRGIILEVVGGVYRVLREDGVEVSASLRGRLKQEPRAGGRVVPGDRVLLSPAEAHDSSSSPVPDSPITIEEILPRSSELLRGGMHGKGERIIAANVDRCVVVLSAAHPPFRPEIADRFLALAELSHISPVLVLNKLDLVEDSATLEGEIAIYREIGYTVLLTSAHTGEGCAQLADLLSDGISLLMGPSGVGKSSLLNALDPDFRLRIGEVGRAGRGKHTTVGARLLPFGSGGWVVDSPGFSDASLAQVEVSELEGAFPEIAELSEGCRFRGCSHLHEPECAVREGVEEERIAASRFESYCVLAKELKER